MAVTGRGDASFRDQGMDCFGIISPDYGRLAEKRGFRCETG